MRKPAVIESSAINRASTFGSDLVNDSTYAGNQPLQMQPHRTSSESVQMQPIEEDEGMLQMQPADSAPLKISTGASGQIQRGLGDWAKRWLLNGEVVNNSPRRVRVWSSDRQGDSEDIEDGLYWIDAHSSSEDWGEDVDHVQDQHGRWYKIGWNTATVDEDGNITGYECRVSGPGQGCPEPAAGGGGMDAGVSAPSDAGGALPGGVRDLDAGVPEDAGSPVPSGAQFKLEIGQPDDQYEQEADAVADKVVKTKAPSGSIQKMQEDGAGIQMQPMEKDEEILQMKCAACEKEESIQKKPAVQRSANGKTVAAPGVAKKIRSSGGKGQFLSGKVGTEMSQTIGADFSGVKIHTGSEAVQLSQNLGAKAFTVGNNIYFNKGQYNPASNEGKHLLAHELTHTVQQGGAGQMIQKQDGAGSSEREGTFHHCSDPRIEMIRRHQPHAVNWVRSTIRSTEAFLNNTTSLADRRRFLAAYFINFDPASIQRMTPAVAATVIPHLRQVKSNLGSILSALNDINYVCFTMCRETELAAHSMYEVDTGGGITMSIPASSIRLCPLWFNCSDFFKRVSTLIHEVVHRDLLFRSDTYEWDPAYLGMSWSTASSNPDSYAVFARMIYHFNQSNMGPASHECAS